MIKTISKTTTSVPALMNMKRLLGWLGRGRRGGCVLRTHRFL
jgi:hypothetical protein